MADGDPRSSRRQFLAACSATPLRAALPVDETLFAVATMPEGQQLLALDANPGEKVYRHGPYDDGLVGIAPLVVDGVTYAAVGDSVYAIGES